MIYDYCKMKIIILLFTFLLLSCHNYHMRGEFPLKERYSHEVDVAKTEWSKVYDSADCDPSVVKVVITPEVEAWWWCRWHKTGDWVLYGCYSSSPDISLGTNHLYIFINNDASDTQQYKMTVVHELMHFFADCSDDFSDSQPRHDDPVIWGKDGILKRIEAIIKNN